ncbi:hypothetical protein D9619_010396 [Psilocybe cf. subviscida]|uniref:Muconate cycloisomerase 1 n=1 Tax=Psilocybe cf. subviscida TaxID=2480587 RepID=A0A8H5ASL9_9AGAR|nr:hypothetical protein D9619_010396 [Psilocybe cf. subviscida]
MDLQQTLGSPTNSTAGSIYYILTGSFRSLSLFLLAFSTETRHLSHVETIPAFGPHQYLGTNLQKDRVYATSWALPPALSSWEVLRPPGETWSVRHINSVPITATSSYVTVPAPYRHVYSAGGPTGEVHIVDEVTGGLSEKIQQLLFVPEDELESADKTRVALRYGSHGVEFTSRFAFIPVLGTDTIEMYERDLSSGKLNHIASVGSPRGKGAHDGPRHVKIHPNGKVLYSVTEHTNMVDAYKIQPTTLEYVASQSLLPEQHEVNSSQFRGDTLMLAPPSSSFPSPRVLFTTTRGGKSDTRGWLSAFALDEDGLFTSKSQRFETPTSGGKANAIDLLQKNPSGADGLWIVLTDDDDATASSSGTGSVRVLEWDETSIQIVCEWPSSDEDIAGERILGASHAIWLD